LPIDVSSFAELVESQASALWQGRSRGVGEFPCRDISCERKGGLATANRTAHEKSFRSDLVN
jgi:hypothetical protein